MRIPQVALVGRPNVGKSSLFNWLARKRLAIVDDMAGVTRDRVTYLMQEGGRFFELVDTGGMGIEDVDQLTDQVESQIAMGMNEAHTLLFVVDTHTGVTPLDKEVARRIRYLDKQVIAVANKTDSVKYETQADEFIKLGFGPPMLCSTRANRGRDELLQRIVESLPDDSGDQEPEEPAMKVAIVGRRNVGKSTFVNTLVHAERMIVSEVPGTTRDSVDVQFELDGKAFVAIDTPGLRRTKSVRTDIDFYGTSRAKRSIRRADVVLLFFDPKNPISRVEKQLCGYINEHYKPCVFVVNKWDLVHKQMPTEKWVRYLRQSFPTMAHAPIAFITGQTGKNVKALLNHAQMLFKQARYRVPTGKLNRLLKKCLELHAPPLYQNRRPKIYYATQVGTEPPTIVLVCNQPQAFSPDYRRYLLGVLRDQLSFGEVPIKLYLNQRGQEDQRDDMGMDANTQISQGDG
ncbi:MAG: ribosome biogenesis GTPase Der [Pirellulales bacterium]